MAGSKTIRFLFLSLVMITGLSVGNLAMADTASGGKNAEFRALYNQVLANPTDQDLTLKYAKLASDIGDYEAAVPPLERLLMKNPNEPKLRLELGILYYLLGSYDMAKTYLQEAKLSQTAQPEIVKQADDYLQKM